MAEEVAESDVRVDPERLESFCAAVFEHAGCDSSDAEIIARALVSADVRGTHSHGTHVIGMYASAMRAGRVNATARPWVVTETPGMVLWDGDRGLGHAVGYHVIQDAIARTRDNGVGITLAVVRNSSHLGAVGWDALLCAEADMLGLSMSSTPPIAAVPGGRSRTVGNAPFSWGAPANDEIGPMVFDAAWSKTAGGRLMLAGRRGEHIAEGLLLDQDGEPTTDPKAFLAGGALTTVGAHKGFGMVLLVELLTVILGGGTPTKEISDPVGGGWSHAFMIIDPSVFGPIEHFKARLAELVRDIHSSPRADGVDRLYVPGELELDHAEDSRVNGLMLGVEIWSELVNVADEYGVGQALENIRI